MIALYEEKLHIIEQAENIRGGGGVCTLIRNEIQYHFWEGRVGLFL